MGLTVGTDSESQGSKALNDSTWDNNLRGLLQRGRRSQNILVLFYQRARRGSTEGRESLMEVKLNILECRKGPARISASVGKGKQS